LDFIKVILSQEGVSVNALERSDVPDMLEALPEDVPVVMPELPLKLVINTVQQFKAVSDPMRMRILGIIQNRPTTAKQVADQLGATPGAIGHHLHVLEEAGLAQVVARRVIRGIIANYYTRTARIFTFNFPPEVRGERATTLKFVTDLYDEISETLAEKGKEAIYGTSFPRARLSPERVEVYKKRLDDLIDDFIAEKPNPDGQVYALFATLFLAPRYVQGEQASPSTEQVGTDDAE
jgi:DNA-binding transcriptional ArsR family regulator